MVDYSRALRVVNYFTLKFVYELAEEIEWRNSFGIRKSFINFFHVKFDQIFVTNLHNILLYEIEITQQPRYPIVAGPTVER